MTAGAAVSPTVPRHPLPQAPDAPRHLILFGAASAHLALVRRLVKRPLTSVRITWITRHDTGLCASLLADWMAGSMPLERLRPPVAPLARQARIDHQTGCAFGLDRDRGLLMVKPASGQSEPMELRYDWISLDDDWPADRSQIEMDMPGARAHALLSRPDTHLIELWPRLLELARDRPIHLAVVGHTVQALELAVAAQAALTQPFCARGSRVTLVTQDQPLPDGLGASASTSVTGLLRRRQITLLRTRCTAISSGEVALANGARLVCDACLLVAAPALPPEWRQPGASSAQPDASADPWGRLRVDPRLVLACPQSPGHIAPAEMGEALHARLQALTSDAPLPHLDAPSRRWLYLGDRLAARWQHRPQAEAASARADWLTAWHRRRVLLST